MPITVTLPTPYAFLGPGAAIQWSSSLIGPLPTGSQFRLSIDGENEFLHNHYQYVIPTSIPLGAIQIGQTAIPGTNVIASGQYSIQPGHTAYLQITLEEPGTPSPVVVDTGTTSAPWDPQANIEGFIVERLAESAGHGVSTAISSQITDIQTRVTDAQAAVKASVTTAAGVVTQTVGQILSGKTLDLLTLDELTSGPTSDPVRVSFSGFYFGVIVRTTTIPYAWQPIGPDQQWYPADLAVCRIIRGSDLEFRAGIHTPTWMQPTPWRYGSNVMNESTTFGVPPDLTIAVDWGLGCAGQVYLMRLP